MIGRPRETALPFEAIADALDEPAGRAAFVRGLTLGALVGAAVVGSLLRARRLRTARRSAVGAAMGDEQPDASLRGDGAANEADTAW